MHARSCVVRSTVPGTPKLSLNSGRGLAVRCPLINTFACPPPTAACAKLRQLAEAAKSGAAERSPHAKAEYSTEEFEALVEK